MRFLPALVIVFGVFGLLLLSTAASGETKPNLVFILADDLGSGDLGCYGQKIVPTPNFDRMAAEGMRFTNAYAGSSCCGPSRCALMTGLHPGHMSVRDNGGSLTENDVTIAAVLKKAGYATGAFGKWHLGAVGAPGDPNAQGFDLFYGINPSSGGSETHFSPTLYRNGQPETVEANRDGARGAYGDDLFLDEALRFVRAHREKPFFVYLALRAPHKSLEAPEEDMRRFRGKFDEKPFPGDGQVGACEAPRAARAAMIAHMDGQLPRLFDALRELELEPKTLVLFASDNGPATAGGSDPAFFGSAGGLRGYKFTMYEGGLRVPLIARWPGTVPAGATCDLPCAFWDFMPTLAELGGAACPKTDGLSIVAALKGERPSRQHDYLYWERAGVQAVRADGWKAIVKAAGGAELFHLPDDPAETTDRSGDGAAALERVRTIMHEAHVDDPRYPLEGKKKKSK